MQCNIDAQGKRVRLIGGILTLLGGIILCLLSLGGIFPGGWYWLIPLAVIAGGVLQLYEARAGWCALRALGIRTPV